MNQRPSKVRVYDIRTTQSQWVSCKCSAWNISQRIKTSAIYYLTVNVTVTDYKNPFTLISIIESAMYRRNSLGIKEG